MAEREEMEFGDLVFGVDEDVDVEEEEEEEEDEVFGRNSREGFHQRSISALTVGVRRMNCDVPSRITGGFGIARRDARLLMEESGSLCRKSVEIDAEVRGSVSNGDMPIMGTSAPVFIPDMRRSMHNHELSLGNLDEEIEDEVQRSSTFVPPHLLMGEKPLIEFSLNSSMAEKRAHLRARTEILRRTGFIETAATPVQTGWRTRGSSANANMFAHISGAMEKCTKRASALSMKFAPPEKIGN